jgi:hypothetical protein
MVERLESDVDTRTLVILAFSATAGSTKAPIATAPYLDFGRVQPRLSLASAARLTVPPHKTRVGLEVAFPSPRLRFPELSQPI